MHLKENINIEKENNIDFNSFKNELNLLQKNIIKNDNKEKINFKINSKTEFKNFLIETDLKDFDRAKPFGRYLRVLRYENKFKHFSKKHWIPSEYIFALAMIESQWNPASINLNDWGAWILHFQPDVARQYWLRVFTDLPKYKKYKVSTMKKQINPKTNKNRELSEIYAKHAKTLRWLWVWENKLSMSKLEALDERFNSDKCINAACKYMKIIRTKYVNRRYKDKTSNKSRNKYKQNEEDFKWILTANWFNKWPYRFTNNFEEGSHVSNFIINKKYLDDYNQRLENLLSKWLTWNEILEKLEYPISKTTMKNPEKERTYYKYDWPSTNKDSISNIFDNRDKKHNQNKYKNTGKLNIFKAKSWSFIIKAKTTNIIEINTNQNKGPFTYERISNDKEYKIYSYIIKNGGNYWWVLKQFQKKWWKLQWTLVTDSIWTNLSRTQQIKKNTKVYIKESIK